MSEHLTLCMLGNYRLMGFSHNSFFQQKKSYTITTCVSNILDPDQAQHLDGPGLDINCLPYGYQ